MKHPSDFSLSDHANARAKQRGISIGNLVNSLRKGKRIKLPYYSKHTYNGITVIVDYQKEEIITCFRDQDRCEKQTTIESCIKK